MKNLFKLAALMAVIFSFPLTPAFAGDVQVQEEGVKEGDATILDFTTNIDVSWDGYQKATIDIIDDPIFSGDVKFRTNLISNGRYGASTQVASSSTNLAPTTLPYGVILKNVGGDGGLDETDGGTRLPNGTPGQYLAIIITGLQTNGSWIITPLTKTGFSTITFDTRGDTAELLYVNDTIGWIITANGGAVIAPVNFGTGI